MANNATALWVINRTIRLHAETIRVANKAGVPELARVRRHQIVALNDVRRILLGRAA